jgi:hypothetical protein
MKNNAAIWEGIGDESTQDNALVRALKLGLDVHYRQVTVAMQEDGGRIKAAGKMGHGAFLGWVCTQLEEGWRIDSCYEAGASGYWLHRELVKLGVRNLVVAPKAMGGAEAKRQKTDKRDSAQLCDALDHDAGISCRDEPSEDGSKGATSIRKGTRPESKTEITGCEQIRRLTWREVRRLR